MQVRVGPFTRSQIFCRFLPRGKPLHPEMDHLWPTRSGQKGTLGSLTGEIAGIHHGAMTERALTEADLAEFKRQIDEIEALLTKLRQALEVAAKRARVKG